MQIIEFSENEISVKLKKTDQRVYHLFPLPCDVKALEVNITFEGEAVSNVDNGDHKVLITGHAHRVEPAVNHLIVKFLVSCGCYSTEDIDYFS